MTSDLQAMNQITNLLAAHAVRRITHRDTLDQIRAIVRSTGRCTVVSLKED